MWSSSVTGIQCGPVVCHYIIEARAFIPVCYTTKCSDMELDHIDQHPIIPCHSPFSACHPYIHVIFAGKCYYVEHGCEYDSTHISLSSLSSQRKFIKHRLTAFAFLCHGDICRVVWQEQHVLVLSTETVVCKCFSLATSYTPSFLSDSHWFWQDSCTASTSAVVPASPPHLLFHLHSSGAGHTFLLSNPPSDDQESVCPAGRPGSPFCLIHCQVIFYPSLPPFPLSFSLSEIWSGCVLHTDW